MGLILLGFGDTSLWRVLWLILDDQKYNSKTICSYGDINKQVFVDVHIGIWQDEDDHCHCYHCELTSMGSSVRRKKKKTF